MTSSQHSRNLRSPRRPRLLPSPAAVLAAVALLAATGGAGYAAGTVGTADLKDDAVISPKVKDGSLTTADLSEGTSTALGYGRAYAYVGRQAIRGGEVQHYLDTDRTSGVTALSHPSEGTFCLTLARRIGLRTVAPQVSVEFGLSAGADTYVQWVLPSDGTECGPRDVEVHTVKNLGDDEPSPSDDVAFSLFVP